jgi:adenosylhomocysteine nucleosidase
MGERNKIEACPFDERTMPAVSPRELPNANLPRCHVGLVFAMPLEAAPWERRMTGVVTVKSRHWEILHGGWKGRGVAVIHSGVGRDKAAQAAEVLIYGHRPNWVISAGLAGGLDPTVKLGDIVMPDAILGEDGRRLSIDLQISAEQRTAMPGVHVGPLLTIDRVALKAAEKRQLGEQFGALAVDMEALGVAETCGAAKQRFLSVRVITDTVDDDLPVDVERLIKKKTWVRRLSAAAGTVIRRPSTVKDLWRLRETAHVASQKLAKFLEGVIEQLG